MLVNFFHGLKDAGVPVTTRELLDLLQAMKHNLAFADIDAFYNLSRAVLVKDEKYYDRFDRAFGAHFRELEDLDDVIEALIPDDWLRSEFIKQLSEEEKQKIESLGGGGRGELAVTVHHHLAVGVEHNDVAAGARLARQVDLLHVEHGAVGCVGGRLQVERARCRVVDDPLEAGAGRDREVAVVSEHDHARRLLSRGVHGLKIGDPRVGPVALLREAAEDARAVVRQGHERPLHREHHQVNVAVAVVVVREHVARRGSVPEALRRVLLFGAVVVPAVLGQHGVHAGDRSHSIGASPLEQTWKTRKDRRRESACRRWFPCRQADLTPRRGDAGDRIQHEKHARTLRSKILCDGRGHLRRPSPQQRALVSRRNDDDRPSEAILAKGVLDEFRHFPAALTNQGDHVQIR